MTLIDELKQHLAAAPDSKRTRQGYDYLRIAETHLGLVQAMLDAGLKDRPPPRKPTYPQRLRLELTQGTFKPPNADELLTDLDRAQAGDRAARERIIDYLNLPGVREALNDC